MKMLAALATAMVIGTVSAGNVMAQAFPTKAVRIVVPFPAGGSFDVTSRILAQRMGPAEIVARLNSEIVRALNLPDVRDLLKTQAIHATPSTPEEFATLLRTDAARYAKIAREANVKVD